ncbi:GIN domain-containing protein [Chloroflexota bacterium]
MKFRTILVLIVLVGVLAGCGTGQAGQTVPLTEFDEVEISNGFYVDIVVGGEYSVKLKVADDILEHVEAVKDGSTLKIRPKPLHNIPHGASLNAEVIMPTLTSMTVQNGSHVTVNGSGGNATFNITGGSHADLGDFAVENAELTTTSGSHVTVNVSGRLDVKVSGGSHVRYSGEPQIGDVDFSGGSTFKEL